MTISSSLEVLQELRRSELYAVRALSALTEETEYLRVDLEEHLARLQVLFGKMAREEVLLRDREALQQGPPRGIGEWLEED